MQPGEQRQLHTLLPGFNQVATIELSARGFERVALLSGHYDLLRIEAVTRFADGQTLPGTLWADRTGEVLKNRSDSMSMDSYRCDQATALQKQDVGKLDLTLGYVGQGQPAAGPWPCLAARPLSRATRRRRPGRGVRQRSRASRFAPSTRIPRK